MSITAVRAAIHRLAAAIIAAMVLGWPVGSATAQESAADPAQPAPPQRVELLLELLRDPDVQKWLAERDAPAQPAQVQPVQALEQSAAGYVSLRLQALRDHIAQLAAALPRLPGELERAWIILSLEFQERGLGSVLLLIGGFIGLGFGFEWLYWRLMRGARAWIIGTEFPGVGDRLRAMAARLAYGLGWVTSFAIGSVGAFLSFNWPLLLREIVLGYLVAFLVLRLTRVATGFLLAPGGGRAARFRIIPMSDLAAKFWTRRLLLLAGIVAFAWVTLELLMTLGLGPASMKLVSYIPDMLLLGIGIEIVWRRPRPDPGDAAAAASLISPGAKRWLATGSLIVLWLLWALSMIPLFSVLVVGALLPMALSTTRRSVAHLLRPAEGEAGDRGAPVIVAVSLERGLRAALITLAVLFLAQVWGIDLIALTERDTVATRLIRGGLSAVVIVLAADFLWHLARALIDRKISDAMTIGHIDSEEARRRARLRTLLPILRNLLLVVVMAVAAMMVLSALGVEIGPLIAGAGVVGVAVGFGAQTLVKDIISGVFYLLDDAFRVGEYIQSGSYKGTVESFSLRSVKLRHHRGPLFTVPFGELGAVQNMSRDWVIDKMTIGVAYDTDLDKAKKLIKQVGKDLSADPEFAPHIIEPLKMQGVEQFGDYAIQIRMKMMTKPGEQFVIRRKAFALIKKAFDANGISFAFPTVQVAQGEESAGAARQMLELAKPPAPETA